MSLPDTLLVGAVDLQSLPLVVADFSGLHAPGTRRGSNLPLPGVSGETGLVKARDAYTFDVPVTVLPDYSPGLIPSAELARRAQFVANLATVQAALNVGFTTLTRKLAAVSGGTLDTTCRGEYVAGLALTMLNANTGNTVLQLRNLDGCWYGTALTPTIPATITAAGTERTSRITLTLPGAGTLANTTLGVSVTVTTGPVTLDVEAETSTGSVLDVVSSGDPLDAWFTLAPGSNAITWSGSGTPTISYTPAYL